ncbi:MAG: TetR/AcrR family transcriptional regulator [Myxococcaceae bacterium]|jgi:AcrR family transcriptional regulator|nr:TetR/AcrR family transcriptional regulator [Myxococcaceae bacterium]
MEKTKRVSPRRIKRRAPSRYHHGDLRRALLDLALRVVEREGVEAVKLNALASELRVSVAAPFRHFPTREALLVTLAEEGADQLVAAMEAAAARAADPLEAQRARGVAYVRFAVEQPGAFSLLTRVELLRASPRLRELSASQQSLMEPILGRQHRGHASRSVARRSAGFLAAQALTYGLARMLVDGLLGEVSADDAERLAIELTGVLGEGLLERR